MQLQKDFAKCSHWKQGWRTFLFSPLVSSTSRVFSTDFSATSSPVRFSYARALWSAEPAEEVQIRGFTSIVVGVIAVHIPPRISPNSSDFLMVSCRIVRKKILEIQGEDDVPEKSFIVESPEKNIGLLLRAISFQKFKRRIFWKE